MQFVCKQGKDTGVVSDFVSANVNPHGAVLLKLTRIN